MRTPLRRRDPFGHLTELQDILYHHGLDAAMFQRFVGSLGVCFMWSACTRHTFARIGLG